MKELYYKDHRIRFMEYNNTYCCSIDHKNKYCDFTIINNKKYVLGGWGIIAENKLRKNLIFK